MTTYIMRLDDACPHWDAEKWSRMEEILDTYGIKPLVGLIPAVEDPELLKYPEDKGYWDRVKCWKDKGWELALHGCTHLYETAEGGINPVQKRSEFAGLPFDRQKQKIRLGVSELASHGIDPEVFFAPSHTFDQETLKALKEETRIRVVSDTFASDVYRDGGFSFVPVQSGHAVNLPFRTVTFCYHPNLMAQDDFEALSSFLEDHSNEFCSLMDAVCRAGDRGRSLADVALQWMYFTVRKLRGVR